MITVGASGAKWMVLSDGLLHVLLGEEPDPAETTVVRSQRAHWSWGELSKGYYTPRVPWGFGDTLLTYDLKREKVLWSKTADFSGSMMTILIFMAK